MARLALTITVAAAVLLALPAQAKSPPFPWKAGDAAPVIDGVKLGDTEAAARAALGAPTGTAKMSDSDVVDYANGLQIIANAGDGVSIIRLRSAAAGAIGGVKVGDDAAAVVARWGDPDATAPGVALYNAGVWTVELRAQNGKVVDMLLGWNQTKWPKEPPDANAKVYRPS
jgi:hypothetical protein